mgnify:CR=1 FL=1
MTTNNSPKELAEQGRYIEAGAIAQDAVRVTGFLLTLDKPAGSGDAYTFSAAFQLEDGSTISQFEKVVLSTFETAQIDFTSPGTDQFLGYVIPERLDERYEPSEDTDSD